jgi:hypothetical protein
VVTVPLLLDGSKDLQSADLALAYDTLRLQLLGIQRGRLTQDFDLFVVNHDPAGGTLQIGLGRTAGPLADRGSGSVLLLRFRVRADAPAGRAVLNLRQALGTTLTQLNEGRLDLNPDPSDEEGDLLDGRIRVRGESGAKLRAGVKNSPLRSEDSSALVNFIDAVFATLVDEQRQPGPGVFRRREVTSSAVPLWAVPPAARP